MTTMIETTDREEIAGILHREIDTKMGDGQSAGLVDVIDAIVDCVQVNGGCALWALPRTDDGFPRAHIGGVEATLTNGNTIWHD